jgi:IS30 family transposase
MKIQKEISKNFEEKSEKRVKKSKNKKQRKFKYLSKDERNQIQLLHEEGYSLRRIAHVLGRSPNTISYEFKRVPSGYRADYAHIYARTKLKNRRFQFRKMNQNKELRNYVVQGLKKSWNPHEIAGRLKMEKRSFSISAGTIYSWILNDVRGNKYTKSLYMFRKKRRSHRKRGLHGRIQHMVSIHDRPKVVERRKQASHWETDLVVSNMKGSGALSTSNERVSRYLVVDYVPDRTALSKQKTLNRLEKEFKVRSITFDRGHENARHYECSSKTYFCDPYSSYQRGANENQNKLLRRWFPKGTDFSKISSSRIQEVVKIINEKPRKVLGYMTATEVAMELGVIR